MGDGPERVRGANWAAGGVPSLDLGGVGAGRGMSPGLGERSHPHPTPLGEHFKKINTDLSFLA